MHTPITDRRLAFIYAATIFVSAFLLFQIQPLAGKYILPWFGGSPAVWTTCLLFFQSLLFAGYAYAHFTNSWLRPRHQAIVHIVIIIVALLLLRVLPAERWKPTGEGDPVSQILLILLISVGLPYFVLAATGPLLQAWFSRSLPGRIPYRLYALSNVGSLLALLSYPFFFERMFDVPWQATLWSIGFVAFGLLCGYTAWQLWSAEPSPSGRGQGEGASDLPSPQPSPKGRGSVYSVAALEPQASPQNAATKEMQRPRFKHYVLWLLLPAFASIVLMATTNHVSTDLAVIPFLWVVPLALYLLTFIIAFDRPGWFRPLLITAFTLIAVYATSMIHKNGVGWIDIYDCGMSGRYARLVANYYTGAPKAKEPEDPKAPPVPPPPGPRFYVDITAALAICFAAMFGVCMLCHGQLARLRPPTHYLTTYYLMIALGGALGGAAVSLVAPHLFKTMIEWRLSMFIAAVLTIGMMIYILVQMSLPPDEESDEEIIMLRSSRHANNVAKSKRTMLLPRVLLVALLLPASLLLLDLVEYLHASQRNVLYRSRNFFGTLTIRERDAADPAIRDLVLLNGTTIHGSQFTAPARRGQPTSYYATTSGIGRVLNFYHAARRPGGIDIGDVGLGAGTLAAYALKGDSITFYEINPVVIDLVNKGEFFTYVADCKARGARCKIELGDARLTLEREAKAGGKPRYHVLVLDAFSSDAIPTHLLTTEAFEIYLPRLTIEADDGIDGALVVHISNRYLNLERVVRGAAQHFGLPFIHVYNPSVTAQSINQANWMILSKNKELMAALAPGAIGYTTAPPPAVLWTDARSSLFEILR